MQLPLISKKEDDKKKQIAAEKPNKYKKALIAGFGNSAFWKKVNEAGLLASGHAIDIQDFKLTD